MYRDHRYRKSKTGRTWEPEYLRFPGSRDRVIIHRLRSKHQAEYQLHDSLKKELQDLGVTKIPSSNKIQRWIESLEVEQAATVREKQELQKKLKALDIIQQNFASLLNAPLFQESIEKSENVL